VYHHTTTTTTATITTTTTTTTPNTTTQQHQHLPAQVFLNARNLNANSECRFEASADGGATWSPADNGDGGDDDDDDDEPLTLVDGQDT
jgi:hypothetical protein